MMDGEGLYGCLLHYGLMYAMTGSTLLLFLYFWRKGQLNMDEKPKYQMMEENDE